MADLVLVKKRLFQELSRDAFCMGMFIQRGVQSQVTVWSFFITFGGHKSFLWGH